MSTLQIISPINDARFESLKPVTFTGKVDPGIVTVELKADEQYSLGSGQVKTDGSWSITYSGFTNPGKRKITAFGYDQANHEEETSIIIYVEHTQSLPTDHKLSDAEGCRLFEQGILPILQSADTFMTAAAEGKHELNLHPGRTDIKEASCAYSVSCVMKYIAKELKFDKVKNLFNNTFEDDCVQVTGVEKKLRRLGFLYFLKEDYLAPRGAIGARAPRWKYQGTENGSGHIYFITKDGAKRTQFPNPENYWDDQQGKHETGINGPKWQIKDLHAENLDFFDHVYMQWDNGYTEGFWLPPGIYPLKR